MAPARRLTAQRQSLRCRVRRPGPLPARQRKPGPRVCDALLRAVAKRLRATRAAARGPGWGDQFMAVLPGVASAAQVEQTRQQWRASTTSLLSSPGGGLRARLLRPWPATPSMGPMAPPCSARHDVAMRPRQATGPARRCWPMRMDDPARAGGLDIRQTLGAIAAEEFFLGTSPSSRRAIQLAGFEAWCAWQRPGSGASAVTSIPALPGLTRPDRRARRAGAAHRPARHGAWRHS